jgi:hypothetical protein
MTSTEPTVRDYLRASDEYDVSDLDEIPESVRNSLDEKLGEIAE